MTDKEYVDFLTKCANIPYEDYSWLKDHCHKTLKRPCSPNTRNEHLAILDLIREHEERQWISVSERLPEEREWYLAVFKEKDTGFQLIPRVADYIGKGENKWRIIDEYGLRQEYRDILECIAWMPLPKPYEPRERSDKL